MTFINRARPQFPDSFVHVPGNLNESRTVAGRHIEHLHPFGLNAQFLKYVFDMEDLFSCLYISFQEMTFTLQSPRDIDPVCAVFNRLEQVDDIHPARAGHMDYLDVAGV